MNLLGASKRQSIEVLQQAWEAGLRIFAENRVQEAVTKIPQLPQEAEWHLIGPLQTNKATRAVELFDAIHSVDRLRIAEALQHQGERAERTIPCFLEVNLASEESKHGFDEDELIAALPRLGELTRIELLGLMAIPPRGPHPEAARPWFRRLARLRDRIAALPDGPAFRGLLSMGMSEDFEVAIEEGATHVRVGTALFGPRPPLTVS